MLAAERPRCACHGEPMWRDVQPNGYGWRCSVKKRAANQRSYELHTDERNAQKRERYENLDGFAYNRLLLRQRRTQALTRRRLRHLRRETEGAD